MNYIFVIFFSLFSIELFANATILEDAQGFKKFDESILKKSWFVLKDGKFVKVDVKFVSIDKEKTLGGETIGYIEEKEGLYTGYPLYCSSSFKGGGRYTFLTMKTVAGIERNY